MTTPKSLPPRPSLESVRKQAKKLAGEIAETISTKSDQLIAKTMTKDKLSHDKNSHPAPALS